MDILSLAEYCPRSMLVVPEHTPRKARFPAIDAHNHLGRWLSADGDWTCRDVPSIIEVMDNCSIQGIVNLDGMWGEELESNLGRYDRAYHGRFVTFSQVDWSATSQRDFGTIMARQLEDSVRRGARGLKVWKHLGLVYRDSDGTLIPIDDHRLSDLWDTAASLNIPVLIHIADPVAFFLPLDRFNERWEELHAHPDWHFPGDRFPPFAALIDQFEHLIASHPRTTFIGAHVGCYAENLQWVSHMLDTYANFFVDIAQRISELGRQPYSARRFFQRHADRILFGSDLFPPATENYLPYFRFLETEDEYFPYDRGEVPGQGRWSIYGIHLPDQILRQVYAHNALRLIPGLTGG